MRLVATSSTTAIAILLWATASATAMAEPRTATPPASITVPPGFRIELLQSAQEGEDSWISMSFDPQGRIVVGLEQRGVARLSTRGDGWDFERLDDTLRHCRGVLCAHDAIYVNATDTKEFWRFRDPAGDGRVADRTLLKSFDYRSRYGHGQNQIVLGPDRMLYLVVGNDVSFPEGTSPSSPYRDPRPDRLLPDPHGAGQDDRVGYILRTDPEGREWTVIAGGLRNQVAAASSDESVVLLGLRTLAIALVRGVDLGADATAVHSHLAALDDHPAATVQRELVDLRVATRAPTAIAAVLHRLD